MDVILQMNQWLPWLRLVFHGDGPWIASLVGRVSVDVFVIDGGAVENGAK